mgnify:CR=1 FL=1
MLILSLDTTTRGGSCAVTDNERVLAVVAGDESRTHAERLPAELARALEVAGVERARIDVLAVAIGPGAFTGLRIGIDRDEDGFLDRTELDGGYDPANPASNPSVATGNGSPSRATSRPPASPRSGASGW